MALRSFLFVPADSERKLEKSLGSKADALILDLEDSVVESRKPAARKLAADFIGAHREQKQLYVRVNPLDTSSALTDLASVVMPGLAGVLLPKPRSAADVTQLSHYLDALEAKAGVAAGTVRIMAIATETPQAMLTMQSFATTAMPRLMGVTWGAEDIATAIGAISNREDDGSYAPLYQLAGSLCLLAAAAANVTAIDTMHGDFKDAAGLEKACRSSRRRGFRARLAIHPDQVDTINAAYSPSEAELAHARRIVDAFAANPDAGTLQLDGNMVDKPHLTQARRTLGLQG